MKGSNTPFPSAVYGTIGVPDAANTPPGLYEAAEWTDLNGNFWVFGGVDFTTSDIHATLWKFDPTTLEWTWMKGPSLINQPGVYGTQGVPSPLNYPGSRAYAMVTWVDAAGDLWMYGGFGFDNGSGAGALDELWRYNIANNEWTWMKGSGLANQPGIYGVQQVPSQLNNPPGLAETACGWTDAAGDLWLFGGYQPVPFGNDNDAMWRYNIATNTWTWMSGQNSGPVAANFGTQQVTAPSNTPGARVVYAHWEDLQGNFWLFGGMDYLTLDCYADMWMYNPNTFQWTWMAGSSTVNAQATFTTQCVPGGHPKAVYENRVYWRDQCGRFWSTGGINNDFSLGYTPSISTLWCFDPVSNQFSWVSGPLAPEVPAVFGVQGVAAPSNYPHSLIGPQSFIDANGNFWLMGGCEIANSSFNAINTVWRYQLDPACPAFPFVSTINTLQPANGCAPYQMQFNASAAGNVLYSWDFGDPASLADTSNLQAPVFTFNQPGTYTVTLITTSQNLCSSGSDTSTTVITVYAQPAVNLGSDTTICTGLVNLVLDAGNPGSTYLWSTGATTQTIAATSAGTYFVTVATGPNNLCSDQDTINITQATQPDLGGDTVICAGQPLLLDPGVTATQYNWNNGATSPTITVTSPGLYSVQIINPPCTLSTAMNLSVTPLPVVQLGPDTTLCPGDTLLLDAQNPGAAHLWNTGATSQTITTAVAGTFAIAVTAQGCSETDSINIAVSQDVELGPAVSLCGSFTGLTLDAQNPGANYLWNTGATSQTISVQQAGLYWVTINAGPCTLTDTIEVTGSIGEAAVYVPNSFTPNGDGLNDRFSGYGESFSSFRLLIFNRWGELIFETTDPNGWDGNYNGIKATDDVYVYKLTYTSACTGGKFVDRLGHVLLLR